MPHCTTAHFGTIEYQQSSIIQFPAGLPGFEEEKFFLPIEQPQTAPLIFLQSLAHPDLCFITLPVLAVDPDYRLSISQEDLAELALPEDRQPRIGYEVLCLAIVSVAEDRLPTANLLAPVVVNLNVRRAVQAIQTESEYSHQQPLLTECVEAPCS
jgi:flagellar assembly factor FliW